MVLTNTEGVRLSDFRKSKGITQAEFATLLDCSQPNLNKIEKGLIGISSQIRAKLFSKFPELNPNWLERGMGQMVTEMPSSLAIGGDKDTEIGSDLKARFISNLNRIEALLEEGKMPYDTIIVVFRNFRKILALQEEKIKDLEEDKDFLKKIIASAKNSPFTQ